MAIDMNSKDKNLLKSKIETHNISVKETDFAKGVTSILYRLRLKLSQDKTRIILKIEPVSFILKNKEEVKTSGKLLNVFSKDNVKYLYEVVVEVEIKYLEIPEQSNNQIGK